MDRDPHVLLGSPAVVARLASVGALRLERVRLLAVEASDLEPVKTIAPGGAVRAHIDMLLERIPRTTLQTVVVTNTGGQADAARLNRLCAGIMPHNRRTRLYSWAEAQKNGGVAWQIVIFFNFFLWMRSTK